MALVWWDPVSDVHGWFVSVVHIHQIDVTQSIKVGASHIRQSVKRVHLDWQRDGDEDVAILRLKADVFALQLFSQFTNHSHGGFNASVDKFPGVVLDSPIVPCPLSLFNNHMWDILQYFHLHDFLNLSHAHDFLVLFIHSILHVITDFFPSPLQLLQFLNDLFADLLKSFFEFFVLWSVFFLVFFPLGNGFGLGFFPLLHGKFSGLFPFLHGNGFVFFVFLHGNGSVFFVFLHGNGSVFFPFLHDDSLAFFPLLQCNSFGFIPLSHHLFHGLNTDSFNFNLCLFPFLFIFLQFQLSLSLKLFQFLFQFFPAGHDHGLVFLKHLSQNLGVLFKHGSHFFILFSPVFLHIIEVLSGHVRDIFPSLLDFCKYWFDLIIIVFHGVFSDGVPSLCHTLLHFIHVFLFKFFVLLHCLGADFFIFSLDSLFEFFKFFLVLGLVLMVDFHNLCFHFLTKFLQVLHNFQVGSIFLLDSADLILCPVLHFPVFLLKGLNNFNSDGLIDLLDGTKGKFLNFTWHLRAPVNAGVKKF